LAFHSLLISEENSARIVILSGAPPSHQLENVFRASKEGLCHFSPPLPCILNLPHTSRRCFLRLTVVSSLPIDLSHVGPSFPFATFASLRSSVSPSPLRLPRLVQRLPLGPSARVPLLVMEVVAPLRASPRSSPLPEIK